MKRTSGWHRSFLLGARPAHERVRGNENANNLAKEALQKEITVPIPPGKGEGKAVIKKKGIEIWQKWWVGGT